MFDGCQPDVDINFGDVVNVRSPWLAKTAMLSCDIIVNNLSSA